jgi:hypothetical protein
MDRICNHCHAEVANDTVADWCPACAGTLIEHAGGSGALDAIGFSTEIDHRGVVLPHRHASGGIITPQ